MAKKKTNKKRRVSPGTIIALFLVFFLVAMGIVSFVNRSFLKSTAQVNPSAKSAFPYEVNAGQVKAFTSFSESNELLLLTNTSASVLSEDGGTISSYTHQYANPSIANNSSKFLLYDKESGKYSLHTKNKLSGEHEIGHPILTATMSKNGYYAIASRSAEATSTVSVYNFSAKELFKWNSSSEHIIKVALSNTGKYLAVATMTQDQGNIISKVFLFHINKTDVISTFEYNEKTIADLSFNSNGQLVVIGTDFVQTINKAEVLNTVETTDRLSKLEKTSDGISIFYAKYGSELVGELLFYNQKIVKQFSKEMDEAVRDISQSKNEIAALTDKAVIIYNQKGEQVKNVNLTSRAERIVKTPAALYVLYADEIVKNSE